VICLDVPHFFSIFVFLILFLFSLRRFGEWMSVRAKRCFVTEDGGHFFVVPVKQNPSFPGSPASCVISIHPAGNGSLHACTFFLFSCFVHHLFFKKDCLIIYLFTPYAMYDMIPPPRFLVLMHLLSFCPLSISGRCSD
jgi:hypothetical protein